MLRSDFIQELIQQKHKEVHCRLTLLNHDETPKATIEGFTTGGSINVDGKSAARRSCSLSLVASGIEEFDKTIWGIKEKFVVEIGLNNTINPAFEDVIWFIMGTYAITSFSSTLGVNTLSINIQGKDKMCFLDGSLGGKLAATHDFGAIEVVQENGDIILERVPIREIILEAVHTYAGEPYHNIIINDLPEHGLDLQAYRGTDPLYFIVQLPQQESTFRAQVLNAVLDGDFKVWIQDSADAESVPISSDQITYLRLNGLLDPQIETATKIAFDNSGHYDYYVSKYQYGDSVGYRQTELTYAGELTANIGEALTSVLDKIRDQLGEYEYFYNVYGQFVFQKKHNYLYGNFNALDQDMYGSLRYNLDNYYSYEFINNKLVTNIARNPAIQNIKNDYIVWGSTKSSNNNEVACHSRIAIDNKPTSYTSIEVSEKDAEWLKTNYPENYPLSADKYMQNSETFIASKCDWRELIFRMQADYYKYHLLPDFLSKVQDKNSWCRNGVTGYEQYYEDLQGFWRLLYNPELKGKTDEELGITYDENGWSLQVYDSPETLLFWFDFINPGLNSELEKNYSVKAIGDRTNPVSAKNVTAIFYPQVPSVIFLSPGEAQDPSFTAYTRLQLPNDSQSQDLFSISSRGYSAIENTYSLVNSTLLEQETITITTVPMYNLEPNTRIYVKSDVNGIDADYIVNSFSIPLTYNGTMNLVAARVNPEIIIQ